MLGILFETSWEVCNKVGGIYAVLSTKAKTVKELYGDDAVFIGPDLEATGGDNYCFSEVKTHPLAWLRKCELPWGIKVRVGRWKVPGNPIAVLVDYRPLFAVKNDIYASMWEHYGVDSLHAYGDYDESCAFAIAAAGVIETVVNRLQPMGHVIAHFDEWTTGMGLLYTKLHMPQVATVFTTHATSIGRSICGNGKALYDFMPGYFGDQMAAELNMQSKHSLEKAAAHAADAFTTVSEVTARECEQLLERRPLVTPNAFEGNFVPSARKFNQVRKAARARLLNVASALTGQQFDDDALVVATSGRCEFRSKGIDAYLDALNVLRTSLAQSDNSRQVVAFVLVPAWVKQPRTDLTEAMGKSLSMPLDNPIITHELNNHGADSIENKMLDLGFSNREADKVKVIYVPAYLNGDDGIVNMSYYDVLTGLDLTVFPSYYEPWGYTPLESMAFAVPSLTTDLAGFGQWAIDRYGADCCQHGVKVIHRSDSNYSEAVHAIAASIKNFYDLKQTEVKKLRTNAREVAAAASWSNFMDFYANAYDEAVRNAARRNIAETEN